MGIKVATVLTLVPTAQHPLEYTIILDYDDCGTEHDVPADWLEPLKIEEIKEGLFGSCIVNDLLYCKDHRLEVCGSCGVDHRMINYQVELLCYTDAEDVFDVVDRLLEEMRRIGAPSRQAPMKRSTKKSPLANKAFFRPVVNDNLVLIQQDSINFNPASTCEPWPRGLAIFNSAAETASAFGAAESTIPEFAKLPVRRVRENVIIAARHWDRFLASMSSTEPMMRLMLQDKAQTQVLSLDLVPPIRFLPIGGQMKMVPVFIVRWARSLASSIENAFRVMGTMERNTKMGEIPVEVDEVELMAALLVKNAERLDPAFVRSVEKHADTLSVSFLTPITEAAQNTFYQSLDAYCYQCGTSGVDVLKCSRCKQAAFCSKECQKKKWKFHKQSCRPSST